MSAVVPAGSTGQAASLGKYRPILELGRGGMATVYLCVLQGLAGFSKLQVVKRLRLELTDDPEFRTMFLEEARLAARINHPNVVQTNEVGIDGRNIFIAMEYLEGQSLEYFVRAAAREKKPLGLDVFLPVLIDTLRGLAFAHKLKDFSGKPLDVVHRDVSPHNILVTYDGHAKVVDFGIAKASDSSQETRAGVLKGKVAYMAPEQVNDRKNVDARADVFAVGAILWRALVGKRLWRGMNDVEILLHVSKGEVPSPLTERPDLDKDIVDICMKALAPVASERYQSADELAAALEGYLPKIGGGATPKAIGEMLARLFEDQRSKVTKAIETRMSDIESLTWEDIDAPRPTSAGYFSSEPLSSQSLPSLDELPQTPDPSAADAGVETLAAPVSTPPSRSRRIGGVLLASAAVIGIVVGVASIVKRPGAQVQAPASGPDKSAAASTAAAAPNNNVELRVALTPASASVFVDDKPLVDSHFARDGAMHRVRAEAAGHETEVQLVSFDNPIVSLTFDLPKAPPNAQARPAAVHTTVISTTTAAPTASAAPSVTAAVVVAPPPATTTTAAPPPSASQTKPKLTIDNGNPW